MMGNEGWDQGCMSLRRSGAAAWSGAKESEGVRRPMLVDGKGEVGVCDM